MDEISLLLPTGGTDMTAALSETERTAVQSALWRLLSRRTALYTLGDSTSVPAETAQELLRSICFTLDAYLKENGKPLSLLASSDIEELFAQGVKVLEAKITTGKALWKAACLSAPEITSVSYTDTLRNIGDFFKRYDCRFFAHDIPCSIDYQLCRPVKDEVLGIDYICGYLRRVLIENECLRRFDAGAVRLLLRKCCPAYRDVPLNLCEPVITNAVGLILAGGDPYSLGMSESGRNALTERFAPLQDIQARSLLIWGAGELCRRAGLRSEGAEDYIADTAADLAPRIRAALKFGYGLESVFSELS